MGHEDCHTLNGGRDLHGKIRSHRPCCLQLPRTAEKGHHQRLILSHRHRNNHQDAAVVSDKAVRISGSPWVSLTAKIFIRLPPTMFAKHLQVPSLRSRDD